MGTFKGFISALDGVEFARQQLGFDPDPQQCLVLGGPVHRGLLNCSRQWGKSTVTAAKAVHCAYSHPERLVVVLSPSGRQSGEFLRKASTFVGRLDLPV